MDDMQVVCGRCGSALDDAKRCPQCGLPDADATPSPEPAAKRGRPTAKAVAALFVPEVGPSVARMNTASPVGAGAPIDPHRLRRPTPRAGTATRGRPEATRGRRGLTIAAAIGTTLAAIAAVAATVLVSTAGSASYLAAARAAVQPVLQSNSELTRVLDSLSSRSSTVSATAAAGSTIGAVQSAQHTLASLTRDAGGQQYAAGARTAMASELAWLHAVVSVLGHPHRQSLSRLRSLGVGAQTKLAAIEPQAPRAATLFGSATLMIAYDQHMLARAGTKSTLTRFGGQVQALLGQSAPGYQEITQLEAATGGGQRITRAQAEAIISTVLASRTAMAASARSLAASTPLAASVRDALAGAYDASVASYQSLGDCLAQAGKGSFAAVLQSCLSYTAPESSAASTATQRFRSVYNELRTGIGQPPTSQQF